MGQEVTSIPEIIDDVRRVFRAICNSSRMVERATGLTGPQLWALRVIGDTSRLNVSELARLMQLHPATVVGILDRLENKGLVMRARSKQDRRVVELTLAAPGKRLVDNAPEVVQSMLAKGLSGLSGKQLEAVEEGMKLLARLFYPQGGVAVPPLPR